MAQNSDSAKAFGRRLVEAMQKSGKVSKRNRSGVDVSALAKGVGVSYEMARRYVEGTALPRPDVVQQIADWLGIDASSLAWGEIRFGPGIDAEVLARCLLAVQHAQEMSWVRLSVDDSAQILVQLYHEAAKGNGVSAPVIAAMLRAMSSTTKKGKGK